MQINIVDVVGRDVSLRKSGSNYLGLCPFHSEKTPSFTVSESKQFYHCFGCGQHGDVIRYVMERNSLSFMEAVEKLAGEYGIRIPERRSSGPRIDYDKYYEINAVAARFFYNCLSIPNNKGLAYFRHRGLSRETIMKFGLGYAPGSGTALIEHLRSEGVSDEDMLKLSLAVKGERGLYDKFRNRVIFPIINTHNKVIGFGGRAIGDYKPKYLNSAESEIFLKKNNLYALNLTKKDIADEDRAIIVEGYMDVISLYQAGIRNVTASLGTALTDNQARLLCRYTKNIILSYDSDSAGIKAALRGISVINGAGGKPRILTVTDGKDPDEFVNKNGKEAFLRLADNAVPAADFRLRLAAEGLDLTDDLQVLEYVDRAVPVLRSLGPVEQDIYIRKLSGQLGISENAIIMAVKTDGNERAQIRQRRPDGRTYGYGRQERRSDKAYDPQSKIELSLLVLAMYNTRYIRRFSEDGIRFRSALAEKIINAEISLADSLPPGVHRIDQEEIYRALDPDEEKLFREIVKSIQIGPDDELFYKEARYGYLINHYRDERTEVMNQLAVAEKTGNESEMEEMASRLIELDKLLSSAMDNTANE
jgi:DNA primase